MKKWTLALLALFVCALFQQGATAATLLYKSQMGEWGANVKEVEGREFKSLVDPAKVPSKKLQAFEEIWEKPRPWPQSTALR